MKSAPYSISPRLDVHERALNAAHAQIKDIAQGLGLTTQERLDLLAQLTVCAALDEADRNEGWQIRSAGILAASQALAIESLQRRLSQAD